MRANKFIAILQAKARRLLSRCRMNTAVRQFYPQQGGRHLRVLPACAILFTASHAASRTHHPAQASRRRFTRKPSVGMHRLQSGKGPNIVGIDPLTGNYDASVYCVVMRGTITSNGVAFILSAKQRLDERPWKFCE